MKKPLMKKLKIKNNKYCEDLLEYFRDDFKKDANGNWEPYTPDYNDIGD